MNQAVTPVISIRLASKARAANPHHHLFNNNGNWWCQFTVHRADHTTERVRVSLQTDDVEVARSRRNGLFPLVDVAEECEISLRFARRGPRGRVQVAKRGRLGPPTTRGTPRFPTRQTACNA